MVDIDDVEEIDTEFSPDLKAYNTEPPLKMDKFSDEEIGVITEVLERNTKVEYADRMRIRKLSHISNQYLSRYHDTIKDRCRFCSSIQVYLLNPLYTCIRCRRFVCLTCLFPILWTEGESIICAHCLCAIITDNRTGKWFSILSEAFGRKRISPKAYIQQSMQKLKKKSQNNENEWIGIDNAISKMNYEETKDLITQKLNEGLASEENAQLSGLVQSRSSRRRSTIRDLPTNSDPQTISISIDYNEKESNFEIFISHCQKLLMVKDKSPNVYVKLNIEPHYLKNKKKPRSNIVWDNNDPIINEKFKIRISQNKIKNGNLIVTICNFNKLTKDNVIGEVIIPIQQTFQNNRGDILSYKIKSSQTPLSSMADKRILITRLMDGLSKSALNYEKEDTDFIELDKDMFEREPHMLTKLKCESVSTTLCYNLHLHVDTLSNIQLLVENSATIFLSATIQGDEDSEMYKTDMLSICIPSFCETVTVDTKLMIADLSGDLNFDSMDMRLNFYGEDGNLMAYSYNSIANVFKKMKTDQGMWFPINFKIRKL